MVYRQLLVSLALAVWAGCGGGADDSSSGVAIALQLNAASCGGEAERIELSCGGTLRVHVARADSSTFDTACLDLGSSAVDFSSLGSLLEQGLSLRPLPADEALRIELEIYPVRLAQCAVDDPGLQLPIISGDSGLVIISQVSGVIGLALECEQIAAPKPPLPDESCADCEAQVFECLESVGATSCQQVISGCLEECFDSNQVCNECSLLGQRCEEQPVVSLHCEGLSEECSQQCGDDPEACNRCEQLETGCFSRAAAIDACLRSGESCEEQCGEKSSSCLRLT